MSWIHVNDLVRLLLFAADTDVNGPLNACSPQPVRNADFTKALAHAVHRPAIFPIPRFALNLALGEMAGFLFDSLRVIPAAAEQAGFEFQHPALDNALSKLVG
jgi:NAD dependent epimerase/dehydratase family enzyme